MTKIEFLAMSHTGVPYWIAWIITYFVMIFGYFLGMIVTAYELSNDGLISNNVFFVITQIVFFYYTLLNLVAAWGANQS